MGKIFFLVFRRKNYLVQVKMSSQKASLFRGLLFVSIVTLFHAAYSVAEWRSLTRNTEGLPIPLDITIQTFVGLILAMIAVLNIAGDFKEIRASVEMSAKSWETVSNRPSFYVYNHRGKALSSCYDSSVSTGSSGRRSLMEILEKFLS